MVLGRTLNSDPGLILSPSFNFLAVWCHQGDHLTSLSLNHISHKIGIKPILHGVAKTPWELLFETVWKLQDILKYTLFLLLNLVTNPKHYEDFILIQILRCQQKYSFSSGKNIGRKQHNTKTFHDDLQPTCFYVWTSLQNQILVPIKINGAHVFDSLTSGTLYPIETNMYKDSYVYNDKKNNWKQPEYLSASYT